MEVPVTTYEAAPTDSCRGVIHGVPAGTSPQELLSHLISTGAPIIKARMMGSTETALITFGGSFVPRYVLYYQGRIPMPTQTPKSSILPTVP
ncbi:hypothetical protein HPB48_008360 [Haemaphysalis longicornis]|uniref:Uncharacterized protein n=1 Tax=Haemaphysalis longicornis TaxID=44386 RepID=A0A9J6FZR6_HAELO|nr:hypothetical protein HPB48_008360 [Haemaphysalis longicornis]